MTTRFHRITVLLCEFSESAVSRVGEGVCFVWRTKKKNYCISCNNNSALTRDALSCLTPPRVGIYCPTKHKKKRELHMTWSSASLIQTYTVMQDAFDRLMLNFGGRGVLTR